MGSFGGKTILWQEGDYRIIEDMERGERWMEEAIYDECVTPDGEDFMCIDEWVMVKLGTKVPEKIIAKALDYGIRLG